MEKKICESCGMPMEKEEDFGGGKIGNRYCIFCTDPTGDLKTYDEVLHGFTNFVVENQGLTIEEAKKVAAEMMRKNPAWKEHKEE